MAVILEQLIDQSLRAPPALPVCAGANSLIGETTWNKASQKLISRDEDVAQVAHDDHLTEMVK